MRDSDSAQGVSPIRVAYPCRLSVSTGRNVAGTSNVASLHLTMHTENYINDFDVCRRIGSQGPELDINLNPDDLSH